MQYINGGDDLMNIEEKKVKTNIRNLKLTRNLSIIGTSICPIGSFILVQQTNNNILLCGISLLIGASCTTFNAVNAYQSQKDNNKIKKKITK